MTIQKPITKLLLAITTGVVVSGAWAQTPASQDRAAVNAQTRQAVATGKMQPAGEAPDPIGGSATPRARGAKAMTHHRHHGHKTRHTNKSAAHHTAARPADQAPEPMTEPKK